MWDGTRERAAAGWVLVVEDDVLIAMTVEDIVRELGFRHVTVAYHHGQALEAIAMFTPSLAVLDITLADGTDDFSIADALSARGAPFVFYSGRGVADLPERHRRRPFVGKPAPGDVLAGTIRRALSN
ncbi:response regulator [Devosia beringensis]|uniref:response regulator n=1 Tax=Devosia beringensis TaxID=2657486 RepID=UPI00186B7DB6|nr:response regulator [Devosia beringensis]